MNQEKFENQNQKSETDEVMPQTGSSALVKDEQSKETYRYPLSLTRELLNVVLNDPEHSSKEVLTLLEQDFGELFEKDAGVWEGYKIGEHTKMVMDQFEKYFGKERLPCGMDKKLFEITLALHDIGKPEATEKENDKGKQHGYTQKIMDSSLRQLGFEEKEVQLAVSLVSGDPIGSYIKGGNIEESARKIVEMATAAGADKNDFFKLLSILYKVDAGSYTEDAGGKRSLDRLFSFKPEEGKMLFSQKIQEKFENLEKEVQKTSENPRKTPELIVSDIETRIGEKTLSPEKAQGEVSQETDKVISETNGILETGMTSLGFSGEESYALEKETGIGAELKANTKEILSLADETTKQFTKEYSPKWRNAEAKRIREMRQEYFQKKQTIAQENEVRAETRTAVEYELSSKEQEMAQYAETLRKLDDEIEERKNTAWFKIKNMFGFAEGLPEERMWGENISKLREAKHEAEEKRQLLAETEDVVLDNAEMKLAKEEVRKFYEEQKGIKDVFEQEKDKERSVTEVAKQKQVLFLHGLPSRNTANTSMNNPNVDTESMGLIDRAKMVIGLEPTISVSTKHTGKEGVSAEQALIKQKRSTLHQNPVLYETGLILNGGHITSAYGGDAGSLAEGTKRRFSKYDSTIHSAIQENFSENLNAALEHRIVGSGISETLINELVVEKPSVSGSFAYFEKLDDYDDFLHHYEKHKDQISEKEIEYRYQEYRREKEYKQNSDIVSVLKLSQELGIPAYGVKENGELFDLLDEDFNEVLPEDVMSKKFSFSADDRINYIKNSMGFSQNETLTKEAQQKLEEIQQMEPEEGGEDVIRQGYRTRAERILYALKFDGRYTQDPSLEETIRDDVYENNKRVRQKLADRLATIGTER